MKLELGALPVKFQRQIQETFSCRTADWQRRFAHCAHLYAEAPFAPHRFGDRASWADLICRGTRVDAAFYPLP